MGAKIKFALSIEKHYTTIHSEGAEVEILGDLNYENILDALTAIKKILERKNLFGVTTSRAVDLYTKIKEHEARREGIKEGKGSAEESFRVTGKLNEANEKLSQKDCQIKGLMSTVDELMTERREAKNAD